MSQLICAAATAARAHRYLGDKNPGMRQQRLLRSAILSLGTSRTMPAIQLLDNAEACT